MSERSSALPPMTLSAIAAASLIAILWGLNPLAVRYAVDELPPVFVAGLRFLIGALFMVGWCRWEGSQIRLRREDLWPCWGIGVLLFIQISLFNAGVERSSSSHGSLFVNLFVFWVIGLEHFLTHTDRLSFRKGLGVTLAALSVIILILTTDRTHHSEIARDVPTLTGDLILCLSAFVLGVKVVVTKQALRIVPPGTLVFWQSVIGTMLFFGWSAAFESVTWQETTWPTWVGVFYQGLFVAGFCFAVQARLMLRYSASQVSIFAFLTPIAGVMAGVTIRNDHLSPWLFLSALGVAAGITLVNWSPSATLSSSTPKEQKPMEEDQGTGAEVT